MDCNNQCSLLWSRCYGRLATLLPTNISGEERCVTTPITAAKETIINGAYLVLNKKKHFCLLIKVVDTSEHKIVRSGRSLVKAKTGNFSWIKTGLLSAHVPTAFLALSNFHKFVFQWLIAFISISHRAPGIYYSRLNLLSLPMTHFCKTNQF